MKHNPKYDVFGFGHICIDYLLVLDPFPEKGKKGDVAESLIIGGGPVPTALKTVVKFGGSARFGGKVGGDADGEFVVRELSEWGVDASGVAVARDETTARAYILIDPKDGSRTVALDTTRFTWSPADHLNAEDVRDCRIFLTDGRSEGASLKGLRAAREAGIATVFDCGTARPGIEAMLPCVDYAIVSKDFRANMNAKDERDLAERLRSLGAKTAVVTMGKSGAWYDSGGRRGAVPAFEIKPCDTTGAGDVFHGAFIYALLQEWSLEDSIRFANAAAALSCLKLSGTRGTPELTDVFALMEEN